MNDREEFNKYNHNERENPHPQYNAQQLYYTQINPSNTERWVKIFDANFQKDPNYIDIKDRQFNRLLFSTYVYNMDDDSPQSMCQLNFYFAVKSTGGFNVAIDGRNLLGSPSMRFTLAYKNVSESSDANKKQFNVRIYARMRYYNERIKLQPIIFDPVKNYNTPYHLESAKSGVNTYERLQAMWNKLPQVNPITPVQMDTELDGYTTELCNLNYGYMRSKNMVIDSANPEIKLQYDGTDKLSLKYDATKDGIYLYGLDETRKFVVNMGIIPAIKTISLGTNELPWECGYFKNIQLKEYYTFDSLNNATGNVAIYWTANKKCLAFRKNSTGKWYDAMGNEITG